MSDQREIAFTRVKLPYGWLGNMAPYPIMTEDGLRWPTSEALFQASRFAKNNPIREHIRLNRSPMTAKMIAKAAADQRVVTPCSVEDIALMRWVLKLKVEQHPELVPQIDDLKGALIVEDVTARPHGSGLFWGAAREADGSWRGENTLGKLWMEICR